MLRGKTIELESPVLTVFTFCEFVSVINSKSFTTGCIVVNNLLVDETETVLSIHFVGSNRDLLLPINDKIDVSE
jgi:hypothetical protein